MRKISILIILGFFLTSFVFAISIISSAVNQNSDVICTAQYDPVCGADGKTYSNECYAQKANVAIECNGTCPCKCSDGTLYGNCSINKPKYCEMGKLINKCSLCGCPKNQSCQENGTCIIIGDEAYFTFDYPPRPETFVIKLTDPEKIQEARDILAGRQTDVTHVMGYIKEGAVSYNPPYDYHLDPNSINFFENAMEICDAGIFTSYPREYCLEYPPGQCTWCPWGSRLIKEIGKNQIQENANNNSGDSRDDIENEEEICCHIYGLGAYMEKVNSRYELIEKEDCVVPKDFVGGGREIVSKKRCEAGYINRTQTARQARNKLELNSSELPENCTRTGSVIRCELQNGKVMIVMAGESGNTIIKFDGENVSTKVQLYHHNGEIYGIFKDNETKLIDILPDKLREIIRERTQARLNNINITLNENAEYEYGAEKESRFLGLFKIKEKVRWNINSETGEILRERGPWWGFLASDVEEE